jgi:putative IMPACT (imprinted ancient) family translation regulator
MCLGYVALSAGMTERCYNKGELAGTFGVLILSAIRGQGLSDTLCVVVRYYGGIKLGDGGLIRAYGGAARLVLRSADAIVLAPGVSMQISKKVANSGVIHAIAVRQKGTTMLDKAYNNQGKMELMITCNEDDGGWLIM